MVADGGSAAVGGEHPLLHPLLPKMHSRLWMQLLLVCTLLLVLMLSTCCRPVLTASIR